MKDALSGETVSQKLTRHQTDYYFLQNKTNYLSNLPSAKIYSFYLKSIFSINYKII